MPRYLLGRLGLFAAVLTIDCFLIASNPHRVVLFGPAGSSGIFVYAVFLCLGYPRLKLDREEIPFSLPLFAAHLLCVLAVFLGSYASLHGLGTLLESASGQFAIRVAIVLGVALLAVACVPLRTWIAAIRETSPLWLVSLLAGGFAWLLREPFQMFWYESSNGAGHLLQVVTFDTVRAVLRSFLPGATVNSATFVFGTPRFSVFIAKECSGMEGLAMVLVFTIAWLTYFRKENRFPQALLLVPCALVAVWLLNIVRLCSLILIGNAGAPEVAMVGFHSQAGWIAFITVAFLFSIATRRVSWVRKDPVGTGPAGAAFTDGHANPHTAGESPATGAFLVPILAILAASLISKAASGYFEWLYPLRFVAAAIALWFSRHELSKLNWRFDWLAPLTGAAIFLMWIVPEWWTHGHASSPIGAGLTALSQPERLLWIAFRVAAAVVTVPIAEELAFRGYMARRLMDREFDAVSFTDLTLFSMAASSLLFGILHGQHWILGTLAGLAYAAVLQRRGRFGDAVVAHATSNLLLAAWVLSRNDWTQW